MLGEPNIFAYIALFLWVPVTLALFWKLRPQMATMVSLLGGVMFLPELVEIDPPALPPFDKLSITALWAYIGCIVACRFKAPELLKQLRPRRIDALFLVVVVGNVGTAMTNGDVLVTGPVVRDALTLYDAFALSVKDLLGLYLPFLLGRAMLRSSRDLADLMRVLVACGIVWMGLGIVELVMSPQLHRWFYGFHTMEFTMTFRFGGYRPTIFMLTGLAASMFMLVTTIAAWARWKASRGFSARAGRDGLIALVLAVSLIAFKSMGAIVYGLAVLPVIAAVKRPRLWLASGLALMVLLFPALRGADLFPTDTLVEWAESVDRERAHSLWFRFDQEDQLLERARERIAFGWGTYNRNRIFDPVTGRDLSVTDGDWMIQLGSRGIVGFVALYGILALSVVLAQRRMKKVRDRKDRIYLGALAMISAVMTVDLLPNGLFHYLPFYFAGAVYGLSDGIATAAEKKRKALRKARAKIVRAPRPIEREELPELPEAASA